MLIEFNNAVLGRVCDHMCENSGAFLARHCALEQLGQAVPIKDVVAENHSNPVAADKVAAHDKSIGKPARSPLYSIAQPQPECRAVTEQPSKGIRIMRRGDDQK